MRTSSVASGLGAAGFIECARGCAWGCARRSASTRCSVVRQLSVCISPESRHRVWTLMLTLSRNSYLARLVFTLDCSFSPAAVMLQAQPTTTGKQTVVSALAQKLRFKLRSPVRPRESAYEDTLRTALTHMTRLRTIVIPKLEGQPWPAHIMHHVIRDSLKGRLTSLQLTSRVTGGVEWFMSGDVILSRFIDLLQSQPNLIHLGLPPWFCFNSNSLDAEDFTARLDSILPNLTSLECSWNTACMLCTGRRISKLALLDFGSQSWASHPDELYRIARSWEEYSSTFKQVQHLSVNFIPSAFLETVLRCIVQAMPFLKCLNTNYVSSTDHDLVR